MRMTIGDTTTMDFFYDQYGRPFAMKHNTRILYYVLNAQGDVTRLIHGNGDGYATYYYDAWGNITYATDNEFTRDNPLRYRGYVYDEETGLYYCQSRYYDPALGRLLNADDVAFLGGYVSKGVNLIFVNAAKIGLFVSSIASTSLGSIDFGSRQIIAATTTPKSENNGYMPENKKPVRLIPRNYIALPV